MNSDVTMMTACPACGTTFRANLTRGECPVCGWALAGQARRFAFPGIDDLDIMVVVAVTAINLLLLAVLVVMVTRR
ncbi:MAG: hypothetical protein ABR598_04195 [Candidatus Dormibacteria bacterium]